MIVKELASNTLGGEVDASFFSVIVATIQMGQNYRGCKKRELINPFIWA